MLTLPSAVFAAGEAIDNFTTMLAVFTPRIEMLTSAQHRLGRSLRLTAALRRRRLRRRNAPARWQAEIARPPDTG